MKQAPNKKIDTVGLRRAITTLAIAAGLAGWAVLSRSEGATAVVTLAAQAQASGLTTGKALQASIAQTPAPRLRAVTAVTSTRSSR